MQQKINADVMLTRFQGDLLYNDICNHFYIDHNDFKVISKNFINILLLNLTNLPLSDYIDMSIIVFNQKEKKILIEALNLKTLNNNQYLMNDATEFEALINKKKTIETEKTIEAVYKIQGEKLQAVKNICSTIVILYIFEMMNLHKMNSSGMIQKIRENKEEIKNSIENPFKITETINEKPKKINNEFDERKQNELKVKIGFILFILFIIFISWLLYVITDKKSFFWKMKL